MKTNCNHCGTKAAIDQPLVRRVSRSLLVWLAVVGGLVAGIQKASAATNSYALLHTFTGAPTDGNGGGGMVVNGSTIYGVTDQGGTNDAGAIYSVSTSGSGFTLLYSFTSNSLFGTPSPDGLQLNGSTLYGSTDSGGTNSDGTLYSIGTSGNGFQTLHTFTDSPDGSSPGNWQINGSSIFGITDSGGADTNGTVYSIGLGGSGYQILHNFGSIPDDGFEPNFLVVTNGTIFGTTSFGGNSGSNIVIGSFSEHLSGGVLYSMGTDGNNYTILHNFGGVLDGDAPSSFQVVGSTIFGLTTFGGANGTNNFNGRPDSGGTLYSIGTGGNGYQILHSFGGTNDGGEPVNFIVKGSTIFGTTAISSSNNAATVYSIGTGGNGYQILHTFPIITNDSFGEDAILVGSIGSTLYGVTESFVTSNGTAFAIGTDGNNFQTLHNFPADPTDGVLFSDALLVGSTLYGNTSNGGTNDEGVIFALDVTGGSTTNVLTKIISLSGSLAFGSVTTGLTGTATLTIANSGDTNLTVSSINYPSGFSGAFSGTILAGDSTNVTVTFAPTSVTNFSGTIIVASDATSGADTITVSGTGAPAAAAPTKIIGLSGSLAFGNVTTGTTAIAILTIINDGTTNLTVTSIFYPSGFSGAFSGTIAVGGSTNVTVTFAPTTITSYTGTVDVLSDAISGTGFTTASGTGVAGAVAPTKIIGLSGSLAFGSVTTGATATAVLTISNTGNTNLTVSSIAYPSGFSGAFSGTIRNGGSTNVTVTFAPTAVTNYSGTITVTSDATSGTSTISASGSGVATALPTKIIGLSGNLAFGNVVTGATATATLTITNSGNATLTVSGISYPTGFSGVTSAVIPAGGSQNITVTFAPVSIGVSTGAVVVTSDATSGTASINASGTGIATVIGVLTVSKVTAAVDFAKAGGDSASVTATLDLGAAFVPTGQTLTINVGGVELPFTLSKTGAGTNGKSSVHFTNVKKTTQWKLTISMKDGSWQPAWFVLGFTNTTIKKPGTEIVMPVQVTVDGQTFAGNSATLHYTATEGKKGSAK